VPGNSGEPELAEPAFPFRNRLHVKARRLVPDFDQAAEPVRPAREFFLQSRPVVEETEEPEEGATAGAGQLLRRSWPFLLALALIGSAVWLLPQVLSKQVVAPAPAPISGAGITRPLGLYVDPSSQSWRISWNRDASVLHKAQLVRLFVHDGDEQNGIDLSPGDLESGMYQYEPRGNDVTFRMEATGSDGRVSAESFRLVRTPAVAEPTPSAAPVRRTVAPQAIHRVAPVVPASLRPRIRGKVLVEIRVQVDTRGRVTSATPVSRPHKGLESDLTRSAVVAARAWRFDPAVKDGKAVTGTQTLHFVFER
jgi:TonB family protein